MVAAGHNGGSSDGWLGQGCSVGLACHVGVGLQQVGGTLGLVWGELVWWWNDMVEVAMEPGLRYGRRGGACTLCWGGSMVGLVHGGLAW